MKVLKPRKSQQKIAALLSCTLCDTGDIGFTIFDCAYCFNLLNNGFIIDNVKTYSLSFP